MTPYQQKPPTGFPADPDRTDPEPVTLDSPVYSGRAFRPLWDYVLKHGEAIERFFDGVNVPRNRLFNEDEWFRIDTAARIWKNYQRCVPGFQMEDSFQIGYSAMRGESLGALKPVIQMLPITATLRHLPAILGAYSRIDHLRCLKLRKGRALIEYRINEAFREDHLDSAFMPLIRGYLSAIPTLHGLPAAQVRELTSCIDVFRRFEMDFNAFGYRIGEANGTVTLNDQPVGRWIRIGEHPMLSAKVEQFLTGERAVLWERDIEATAPDGRRVIIASAGDLYNLPVGLLTVEWEEVALVGRLARFISEIPEYARALFRSKHELLKRMQGMQHHAADLEKRVSDRTRELETANRQLAREVGERRLLEGRLWGSLKEKDLLLREIHHRVKNNLQVISSLLDMSANRTQLPEARGVLISARTKIQAMAMIHAGLFCESGVAPIEIEEHATALFRNLVAIYGQTDSVRFRTWSAGTRLSVSQALPCALVINELISNSLKHAFAGRSDGRIGVGFEQLPDRQLELRYQDDGNGLPSGFDIHRTDSLGLKLVRILATVQLNGQLEQLPGPGCDLRIRFPVEVANAVSRSSSAG